MKARRARRVAQVCGRVLRRLHIYLGSIPALVFLLAYVVIVLAYSVAYYSLSGNHFYHVTARYELSEFNADAARVLALLSDNLEVAIAEGYGSAQPTVGGWQLDTTQLAAEALDVHNFPEAFEFRVRVPVASVDTAGHTVLTEVVGQVIAHPLERLQVDGTIYLYVTTLTNGGPLLEGYSPPPDLEALLLHANRLGKTDVSALALVLSSTLFQDVMDLGQGYRGFPAGVQGQYLRMLYFSAGVASSSALGDIVPVTRIARLLVMTESVVAIVTLGLFLNALAVGIAGMTRPLHAPRTRPRRIHGDRPRTRTCPLVAAGRREFTRGRCVHRGLPGDDDPLS